MSDIASRQNDEVNLRRQAAARNRYSTAKLPDGTVVLGSVVLAGASPLVVLMVPALTEPLAALAGLWLFANRLLFRPMSERLKATGATLQDMYDRRVFGLGDRSAGSTSISAEEVMSWSRGSNLDEFHDWYPTQTPAPWPRSVLICQRANAVWGRRQHSSYGIVLAVLVVVWFVAGIVFSLIQDMSLRTWLIAVLLPSLPALLDFTEMARDHRAAASARTSIEAEIDRLLREPDAVSLADLDGVQEQLRAVRVLSPLVPDWYYRRVASEFETDMQFAATQQAKDG